MTNRYLTIALTAAATLFVLWFAYDTGYNKAKAEGDLALEQLKLAQAQAVIDSQNKVKSEYEVQIQNLNAALASVRSDNANRLRQLEAFRGASTDLATCRRQRDDLSRLAVRGEELLRRADAYLGSLIKN
nr:MAG TPA: hypothetical protein [Caudoviricetes sp.]